MTDRATPDPASRDELASALHDGEATADERAQAADPGVQAEVAVVAAIAARVADVSPPPAGMVDDHVATALAAWGEGVPGDEEGSGVDGGPPVTDLDARRPWWQRSPLGAVAAAAAVVALAGAIGVAAVRGDGADTSADTASATLEATDDAGAEGADGAEAFEADARGDSNGGAAAGSALAAGERESFASYDELAATLGERARQLRPTSTSSAATSSEDAVPTAGAPDEEAATSERPEAGCDAIGSAGIDPGSVQLVTAVVVADRLVTAVVHGEGDDRVLTVVDEETCAAVDQRPL